MLKDGKLNFCDKCKKKVYYIKKDYCLKCGKPVEDSSVSYCYDCSRRERAFDQCRSLYLYRGAVKMAMYRFKYSNRRCYSRVFVDELIGVQKSWLESIDAECIIPIPMYHRKEKLRGYNQAAVLSEILSKTLNIPVRNDVLARCKNTKPMKNLNHIQRRLNLENAFIYKGYGVKYTRVLLVDDIFTTGATFDMAAQVLKRYGVRQVFCVSVCIGWGS